MPEYNQNDLKSTLTYIKLQFGVETLCDSKHLFAYLADLAPNLTKERKMIQRLSNIGVLEDFSKTDTSDEALEKRILAKWSLKLTEEEYIIPEIVNQYLDILAEVFGWQARINLPKPKEESNANSVYTPNSPSALSPVTVYQSAAVSNVINNNTSQTTMSVTQNLSYLKKSTQNLSDFRFYDVPNGVVLEEYNEDGKSSVVIPEKFNGKSVVSIGASAFYNCITMENINIPDSVTTIADCAFSFCKGLKNIVIPDSVTRIGKSVFSHCEKLENIDIPIFVTTIDDDAFSSCSSLKSIVIPNSVTRIGKSVFSHCEKLENIDIPNSITTIDDYAFFGCDSLKSIVIPNSVTHIGKNAFSCCRKLQKVYLHDGVTEISDQSSTYYINLTKIGVLQGFHDFEFEILNKKMIDFCNVIREVYNSNSKSEPTYKKALSLLNERKFAQAALLFGKLGDYKDSYEKSRFAFIRGGYGNFFAFPYQSSICCLNSKGEIEGYKSKLFGYRKGDSKQWYNLVSIYNELNTYGLKSHGKVLMNYIGYNNNYRDISLWSDIVSISVSGSHIVGLKSDGTVVEVCEDKKYTCDNSSNWKDIVSVKTLYNKTIALTKYGSVVTTYSSISESFIRSMNDIIEIDTDDSTSISGLKRNGTVITNSYQFGAANSWNGIVSISMTRDILISLRKDGTVVFDRADKIFQKNLSSWKNIIYISAYSVQGKPLVIGLTYKGDIVADGESSEKLLNLIKGKEIFSKSDIEAFRLNFHERKNYLDKLENEIQYNKAVNFCNNNQFENAALIFKELGSYKDSSDKLEFVSNEVYKKAITLLEKRQFVQAALLFGKLGDYKDSVQKSRYAYIRSDYGNYFGNSLDNFLYLDRSGIPNCLSALDSFYIIFAGNCDKSEWKNLASILLKSTHSVGLKTDGTVLVSYDDQCYTGNVSSWKDIVQISAYSNHTVGLRADGTVVATGDNYYNQCNVYSW